jgi:acetolactate synthase-1/2/3 large subunit
VTKSIVTVKDPARIRWELERALWLALDGRPGPVWLDIPLDVQSAMIDEAALEGFRPPDESAARLRAAEDGARKLVERLAGSKRPIVLAGNGIHLARAEAELAAFVEKTGIPVVETIGGLDLLPDDHPQLMGRVGPTGQRRANFALQNADLLLGLGASFSIASTGFNVKEFAVKAKSRVMVNVDPAEVAKPHFTPDLAIVADVKEVLRAATALAPASLAGKRWLDACAAWKTRYPPITPDYFADEKHANSYVFANVLSELAEPGEVVVTGNSLDIVSVFAAWKVKARQRLYTNINYGQMGWDLPGAIGACAGNGRKRTILITGDGSIMLNLHELAPISHGKLPVKIFVLTNGGYQSIRATQQNFFEGFLVGSSADSGVGIPDMQKLAAAFDLPFAKIPTNDRIREVAKAFLASPGPGLCEVVLSPTQERTPRVKSVRRPDGTLESRSLEDMYPYLPREEVHANMHLFDDDP